MATIPSSAQADPLHRLARTPIDRNGGRQYHTAFRLADKSWGSHLACRFPSAGGCPRCAMVSDEFAAWKNYLSFTPG